MTRTSCGRPFVATSPSEVATQSPEPAHNNYPKCFCNGGHFYSNERERESVRKTIRERSPVRARGNICLSRQGPRRHADGTALRENRCIVVARARPLAAAGLWAAKTVYTKYKPSAPNRREPFLSTARLFAALSRSPFFLSLPLSLSLSRPSWPQTAIVLQ